MHRAVVTDRAAKPQGFYSQAVHAGPFLFVAGQLPLDHQKKLVGDSPRDQALQALQNVSAILEAAGGSISHIVQVTIYLTNLDFWPEVNAAYQEFLQGVPVAPARATVGVKDLPLGSKIEVQAVAYLGNG
jgi:2-iminobutanoate/2-iminopropanoate deaminase